MIRRVLGVSCLPSCPVKIKAMIECFNNKVNDTACFGRQLFTSRLMPQLRSKQVHKPEVREYKVNGRSPHVSGIKLNINSSPDAAPCHRYLIAHSRFPSVPYKCRSHLSTCGIISLL
ncbi:hypothetical protein J6590_022638 [Homalodisca vitripennis]|nr:hypothetical protein J6590_022638 [Homalodisca vitripennis]